LAAADLVPAAAAAAAAAYLADYEAALLFSSAGSKAAVDE
jgi:hypothetical protein